MAWTKRFCISAALSLLAMSASPAADIVVYHNWSSPAELAALNVLRQAVEARGDRWTPLSIPHDMEGDMDVLKLIDGGTSPNAFLQMQPTIYRALEASGKVLHFDTQFAENGLLAQLPDVVRAAITVDGYIPKVPVTIHADATIYYNRAVAKAAGIDPENWTSLDDAWADFGAVRAAGYLPLAMGAQPWQVGYLTHALVASVGGASLYQGLYGPASDAVGLDDPGLVDVFTWLRRFQQVADAGAADRSWNMATNMVISGTALLQLQGDWMKGEWLAAGKVVGEDFGCMLVPGALALPVSVDSWGLLGGVSADVEAMERGFADVMVDPQVQADFATAKGSTPVRLDVRDGIDQCSQQVLAALDRPGFSVLTPHLSATPARVTAIWEVANAYWNDPKMTEDGAVDALRQSLLALP